MDINKFSTNISGIFDQVENDDENVYVKKFQKKHRKRNAKKQDFLNEFLKEKKKKLQSNYDIFQQLQKTTTLEKSENIYKVGKHKVVELINYPVEELPYPELRNVTPEEIDCDKQNIEFQINDILIGTNSDFSEDPIPNDEKQTVVYLSGVTEKGLTVGVFLNGYHPFFYLSIPESYYNAPHKFVRQLETQLKMQKAPMEQIHQMEIVEKHPSTGYRPKDKPLKLVKFEFNTLEAQKKTKYIVQKLYPITTKEDILNDNWKKRNETVVCEADEEEIKCLNHFHIISGGWVRLMATRYTPIEDRLHNCFYAFETDILLPLPKKDTIANMLVDSIDIEQENHLENVDKMPDPFVEEDHLLSIAHAMQDYKKKHPLFLCLFTWGVREVKITEEHFKKLGLKKPSTFYIFRYQDEMEMLRRWSVWWSQPEVSSDIIIGHNILNYDMRALATRLLDIYGDQLEDYEKVWGRLSLIPLEKKESNIQSKAISFAEYTLTPAFGRVFIDTLIMYQRDVTLKLRSYSLNTLAKKLLKEEKVDLHYTEIKNCFYGTPEDRGLLFIYNFGDVIRVFDLCFKSSHIPKCINISRVNHVPLNMLCPRGQSIRVYGGFQYIAQINNYVLYRPYYHPLLDNPIYDDIANMIKKAEASDGDIADYDAIRYDANSQEFKTFDFQNYLQEVLKDHIEIAETEYQGTTNKNNSTSSNDGESKNTSTDKKNNKNKQKKKKTFQQILLEKEAAARKVFATKIDISNLSKSLYNQLLGIDSQEQIDEIAAGKVKNVKMYGYAKHRPLEKRSKTDIKKAEKQNVFVSKTGQNPEQMIDLLKRKKIKEGKGFSGGMVMIPRRGIAHNIPVFDWNSLYPNLMHNFKQCPSLLCIWEEFAKLENVDYIDVRFNEFFCFRYADKEDGVDLPGILIQHTWNLVCNRKIAQYIMVSYETRRDHGINMLKDYFDKIFPNGWGYDPDADLDPQLASKTEELLSNEENFPKNDLYDQKMKKDILHKRIIKNMEIGAKSMEFKKRNIVLNTIDQYEAFQKEIDSFLESNKNNMNEDEYERHSGVIEVLKQLLEVLYAQWSEIPDLDCEIPKDYISLDVVEDMFNFINEMQEQFKNYDSKQNELKVGGNSTFGFAGAGGTPIFDDKTDKIRHGGKHQVLPVSACITFLGRYCIVVCKEYMEEKYGYEIIYVDTDSLFIDVGYDASDESLKKSFPLSKQICKELSDMFPGTMTIKHEKTAKTALFLDPKCYALFKFEKPDDPDGKIDIKGLQIKKRDNCDFVRDNGLKMLEIILRKGDVQGGVSFIDTKLKELIDGKISVEAIALHKKISKADYKGNSIGHIELAKRIDQRKPGQGPKSGESVKYLYVDIGDWVDKKKMHEKIEDFDYVIENKIPVDYRWYIVNNIPHPISKILEPLISSQQLKKLWDDARIRAENKQIGTQSTDSIKQNYSNIFEEEELSD